MIEKRMALYNQFKCTADKCKFTCCAGWDVNVDNDTYKKWKKEDRDFKYNADELVKRREDGLIINKNTKDSCPLLNSQGLCNLVINNGDNYLSKTCRDFPRVKTEFEDIKERTLSCACPEVVEIIASTKDIICFNYSKESIIPNSEDIQSEIKLRDTIINILTKDNINIEEKLVLSYKMLLNILDMEELTEENVIKELQKFNNIEFLEELQSELVLDNENGLKEVNFLLLDMVENYRSVPILKELLEDIYKLSLKISRNNIKTEELKASFNSFIIEFQKQSNVVLNCIIAKVLASCLNEDIEEVALSLELIILEYALVKYSVFLKSFLGGKDNTVQNIKDYIMLFSRIVENNSDAVLDFIEEKFGDVFLDCEYMLAIGKIYS